MERTIARLVDGESFGELALLRGGARAATVRAEVPSVLLMLHRDGFDQLLAENPAFREQVTRMAAALEARDALRGLDAAAGGRIDTCLWGDSSSQDGDC